MDCRTALEFLEVVRPDSNDLVEPELSSAAAHLESCRQCAEVFRGRQTLDRELGHAMRDVPVPVSLKTSLLTAASDVPSAGASLGESASAASIEASDDSVLSIKAPPPVPMHRRTSFRLGVSIAACLAVAFVAWHLPVWSEPEFTLAELEKETDLNLGGRPNFDGSFHANLPSGWSDLRGLRLGSAKGLQNGGSDHVAALYGFQFRGSRRPIDGVLLVIEKSRVVEPPPDKTFRSVQDVKYPQRMIAAVAWTEGDLVYICFVRGGANEIDALMRAFEIELT